MAMVIRAIISSCLARHGQGKGRQKVSTKESVKEIYVRARVELLN